MTDAERDAMRDYIVATIKGTVDAAVAGITIPPAPAGEKGADGKDGRDGRDGRNGIASLDEVKEIATKAVDERLEAEVQKRVADAFAALPALQYRGVFKDANEYRAGDCVSFGGSLWHCNAVTTDKPGDGSDAWTLAVKRGRDGKDAK